jgi:hypothetical protein
MSTKLIAVLGALKCTTSEPTKTCGGPGSAQTGMRRENVLAAEKGDAHMGL